MRIALCNEVVRALPFVEQCMLAAELGYDGIELAPFTLGETPHLLSADDRAAIRRMAGDHGLTIDSLHWLLVTPAGLSITAPDDGVRARTTDVLRRLVGLAADLGCTAMVHGSPAQRQLAAGDEAAGRARARDCLAAVAAEAAAAGIAYCIEPLARRETNFINSVAEAAALVEAVGSPGLRTMVDCSAAALDEAEPVAALLDRWLPSGLIAHVQVNDRNQQGPGQGDDSFAPVFAALRRHGYDRVVAVEPFDYRPDGATSAARAIGYIRGILEALP